MTATIFRDGGGRCGRSGAPPGATVLAAFGLEGQPVPLPGGQGRAWLVDEAVLKPLDMSLPALRWHAELLARLAGRDDLRVSEPLPATDGGWSSSGWTAWRHQPGVHLPGRWNEIIAVGERLHAALHDEAKPAFLVDRTDIWAVADRVAWDELPPEAFAVTRHLDTLLAAWRPVRGTAQLVHGDLTGNVLFHPELPPLVIDLSPYWRPPAFATAVVIADALVFEGAHPGVFQPLLADSTFQQHLLRALIFRTVADHLARPHLRRPEADDPYHPAVTLAVGLAQASR